MDFCRFKVYFQKPLKLVDNFFSYIYGTALSIASRHTIHVIIYLFIALESACAYDIGMQSPGIVSSYRGLDTLQNINKIYFSRQFLFNRNKTNVLEIHNILGGGNQSRAPYVVPGSLLRRSSTSFAYGCTSAQITKLLAASLTDAGISSLSVANANTRQRIDRLIDTGLSRVLCSSVSYKER